MGTTKLELELTGEESGLIASLERSMAGINSFAKDGSKAIEGMGGSFAQLTNSFGAIKEAIAGLAIFEFMKSSVDAAVELGAEVRRLSSFFQIGSEKAGELAEALKRMGSSPDEFITMAAKMDKQLLKNSESFQKYGIETKTIGEDGKIQWKSQVDILTEVGAKLNSIEGDTARTIAAQELLGKGGAEAALYLQKLAAAAQASKENLAAMGVAIDYDSLKTQSKEYAKTQADISQGFNVMKIIVGQELLPSLMGLFSFFSTLMIPAAHALSFAIKGLTTGFFTLKYIIEDAMAYVSDLVLKSVNSLAGVGNIVTAILNGDFGKAKQIFLQTSAEHIRIDNETKQVLINNEDDYNNKLISIWGDGIEKKRTIEKDGTTGGKVTGSNAERAKEASVLKSLQAEMNALDKEDLTYLDASTIALKEQKQLDEADLKLKQDLGKIDSILAEDKTPATIAAANQAKMSALIANDDKVTAIHREAAAARAKLSLEIAKVEEAGERAHLGAMESAKLDNIQRLRSLGIISGEDAIQLEMAIHEKQHNEQMVSYARELDAAKDNQIETAKIQGKVVAEIDKNNAQIRKSNNQLVDEMAKKNPMAGMAAGFREYIAESKNYGTQFKNLVTSTMNAAETSIAGAMKGIITGQENLSQAMKGIWSGITDAILGCITQMIAKWIVAQAAMLIFGSATEVVANTQAAAALDTAAAESYAAYAYIPFGGLALANAQIALVAGGFAAAKAADKGITAFATGGYVDKPTPGIFGEKGGEYLVPERDMKSLIPSLMAQGAAMFRGMGASMAQTRAYASGAYASASMPAPTNSVSSTRSSNTSNVTINCGHILGDSKDSAKVIGKYISALNVDFNRRNG